MVPRESFANETLLFIPTEFQGLLDLFQRSQIGTMRTKSRPQDVLFALCVAINQSGVLPKGPEVLKWLCAHLLSDLLFMPIPFRPGSIFLIVSLYKIMLQSTLQI